MKRGSRLMIILVVVIVILVAAAFFVLRGSGMTGSAAPTPTTIPMVNIVYVKQPINRDDQIKDDAIEVKPYYGNPSAKMIQDKSLVVGKYAIFPLSQGLPITSDMLADRPGLEQPGSMAAKVVSPGLVAISIPISPLGLISYGLRDGDRVNVIATTRFVDVDPSFQAKLPNYTAVVTGPGFLPDTLPVLSSKISSGGDTSAQGRAELDPTLNQAIYLQPSESQRPRLVSQMILQNIQVLHVGDFPYLDTANSTGGSTTTSTAAQAPADAQAAAPGGPTPVPSPTPLPPTNVTLIVSPQDALALTYLMNSDAQFTLVLRAPDDTTHIETEATTLQYLLSQYAIPVPAKLPYVMDNAPAATTSAPN